MNATRRRLVFAVLLGAAVAAMVLLRRPPDAPRPDPDGAADSAPPAAPAAPPVSESPFLNTQPGVEYVGSQVCQECHVDEHETYAATLHSRSLLRVDSSDQPPGGVFDHPLSGSRYEVEVTAAGMQHREAVLHADGSETDLGTHPVAYQVGSGHVARSYLIEDHGFLVQSPISWFAEQSRWAMSPGYDAAQHPAFSRTIGSGCLYCHAGQVGDPARHGFQHQIVEQPIGCERCHGPGALHVQRQTAGADLPSAGEVDRTIVNPGHLSRELGEAICAQCHLQGAVNTTVRGRNPWDYRPGLPLHEYRLEFRSETPEAAMKVAGHVEQMHHSPCYQNSTTLTCATCHPSHAESPPEGRPAQIRRICSDCHGEQPCSLPPVERTPSHDDRCAACHMPQAATEVTHVALTHHRIGIHSIPRDTNAAAETPPSDANAELLPLQPLDHLSAADRQRSLGLAYLELVRLAGKDAAQIPRLERAAALLRSAYDAGLRDPELLTALAGIARDSGHLAKGIELAEQALLDPDIPAEIRVEALDVLAELQFRSGELEQAAGSLRELTRGIRSGLHWYLLGTIERQLGRREEALAAFRYAVRIDPRSAEYRRALLPLLSEAGFTDEAARLRRLDDRLESTDSTGPPQ